MRVAATDEDRARPIATSVIGRVVLVEAIVFYLWFVARATMANHDGFGTFGFDLGIYDQGVWLLSRFHAPFVTVMGRNLFGDHTSFMLLPLVPLYWLAPSAKTLLFMQTVALAAGAVPAFLIGRDVLRSELLAAGIAVAYLAHPAVAWTNYEQFHPDALEVPLLLFALWFMGRQRWRPFLACIAALLLVKEDVVLLTFVLGLYVAIRYDRRVGLITSGASLVYASAAWGVLKALNGVGSLNGWRVPFGGPGGFVKTAVTRPWKVVGYALGPDRRFYAWQMFGPFALLSLGSPLMLVAAGPLGSNLVSTFWYQYHLQYHYGTLIIPVLVASAVATIGRFRHDLRPVVVGVVVVCALTSGWLWGPVSFARHPMPMGRRDPAKSEPFEAAARLIPRDAVVSAYFGYVTHLDHRRRIYQFPTPFRAAYWSTFKQEGQRLPEADSVAYVIVPTDQGAQDQATLDAIRPEFDTLYQSSHVILLKRRAGSARGGR